MNSRRIAPLRQKGDGSGALVLAGLAVLVALGLSKGKGGGGAPVQVSGTIADIRLSQDACLHIRRAEPLLKLWTDTITIDVGVSMTALDGKGQATAWAYQVRTGLVNDTLLPTPDWDEVRKRTGLYPVYSDPRIDDPGMYSQTFDLWPDDQPVPQTTVSFAVLAVLAHLNIDRVDLYQKLLDSVKLPFQQGNIARQLVLGMADAWTNVHEESLTNAVIISPPIMAAGGLVKTIEVRQGNRPLSRWE